MFKFIYELLAGKNADPVYATDVYPFIGLFTLVVAFVLAIVFYLGLGRWKPLWDKLPHWIITLLVLIAIAVYWALTQAKSATGEDYDAFMYKFALVNAFLATLYFVVFSLLLKKASIFAKHTPF
jgi:high-affinity Fe2+/Pb2+ permease